MLPKINDWMTQDMANKRVMLDLETLSTKSNACILSIGACFFNEETIGAEFYQPVWVLGQNTKYGRHVSTETVEWWSKQSEEARKVFHEPAVDLQQALLSFRKWVYENADGEKIEMWGNGADFDCVILGNAYEAVGVEKPWSYGLNRCYRTLKNVVKLRPGFGIPERQGIHHNALADAIYQAQCAAVYLRELSK